MKSILYLDTFVLSVTVVAFLAIVTLLFISEILQRKFDLSRRHIRKAIHVIVGLGICFSTLLFDSNIPILILSVIFLIIDLWALRTHHFTSMHPDNYSLGTVFYPISIFILAIFFWYTDKWIFVTASLLMIIPDALAGLIGLRFANSFFTLLKEKKSLPGTITMFLSSFILIIIATYTRDDLSIIRDLQLSVVVGLIATASELLSIRGSDNLSVPLLSGLFIYVYLYPPSAGFPEQIFTGTLLSLTISVFSYYLGFLSLSGTIGTFILGSIIFGFGGLLYTIPILAFFLVSSLLSRVGKRFKKQYESLFEKTGVRDFYQVWANGGIPAILVIFNVFFPATNIFYAYCAAIAAATADTWGTELGIFSKKHPRMITSFKAVPPGTSGAVSIMGSIASFAGSLFITIIGMIYYTSNQNITDISYIIFIITISGFFGSIIDSIIGATIQAQYNCPVCHKITEKKNHCKKDTIMVNGFKYMNNDLVNFIAIAFSAIITLFTLNIIT